MESDCQLLIGAEVRSDLNRFKVEVFEGAQCKATISTIGNNFILTEDVALFLWYDAKFGLGGLGGNKI